MVIKSVTAKIKRAEIEFAASTVFDGTTQQHMLII